MVYCIPSDDYPSKEIFIEELKYSDKNDLEWRIARIENGFIVKYFGDDYFKETFFNCELSNGKHINIKNTNCIFFETTDFDVFCAIRNIIKNRYTDDIWGCFEDFFIQRFESDESLLKSEIY